jgi:hypothetical protein
MLIRRSPSTYKMEEVTMSNVPRVLALTLLLLLLLVAACTRASKDATSAVPARSDLPESFYLASRPAGTRSVADVKEHALPGDTVVVEGRVGGATDVFIDGVAWFTIVDQSLKPCNEEGPMPDCPTPWDNCCTDPATLAQKRLSIEFSDGKKPLRHNVRGFHGLDHNKIVTVVGQLAKDETGNISIHASGIHVAP